MGCGSSTAANAANPTSRDPEDFSLSHIEFKKFGIPKFDKFTRNLAAPLNTIIDIANAINGSLDDVKDSIGLLVGGYRVDIRTGVKDHDRVLFTLNKADGSYGTPEEVKKLQEKGNAADEKAGKARAALHKALEAKNVTLKVVNNLLAAASEGAALPAEAVEVNTALGELRTALGAEWKVGVHVVPAKSAGHPSIDAVICKAVFKDKTAKHDLVPVNLLAYAASQSAKDIFSAEKCLAISAGDLAKALKTVPNGAYTLKYSDRKLAVRFAPAEKKAGAAGAKPAASGAKPAASGALKAPSGALKASASQKKGEEAKEEAKEEGAEEAAPEEGVDAGNEEGEAVAEGVEGAGPVAESDAGDDAGGDAGGDDAADAEDDDDDEEEEDEQETEEEKQEEDEDGCKKPKLPKAPKAKAPKPAGEKVKLSPEEKEALGKKKELRAEVKKAVDNTNAQIFKLMKATRNSNGDANLGKGLLAMLDAVKQRAKDMGAATDPSKFLKVDPKISDDEDGNMEFDLGISCNIDGADLTLEGMLKELPGPARLVYNKLMNIKTVVVGTKPLFMDLKDQVMALIESADTVFNDPMKEVTKIMVGANPMKIASAVGAVGSNLVKIKDCVKTIAVFIGTIRRVATEVGGSFETLKAAMVRAPA